MKKYEFVAGDEIVIAPGRTLKRIRALVAISLFGVSAGDVGGYVEKEENLSQVYGDARVYGDKLIFWSTKVGRDNSTLTVFNGNNGLSLAGVFAGQLMNSCLSQKKNTTTTRTLNTGCLLKSPTHEFLAV